MVKPCRKHHRLSLTLILFNNPPPPPTLPTLAHFLEVWPAPLYPLTPLRLWLMCFQFSFQPQSASSCSNNSTRTGRASWLSVCNKFQQIPEKADTGKLGGGGNSHGKMGLALTQARIIQTNAESCSQYPPLLPKSLTCNLTGRFQLFSVSGVNEQ